MQPNIDFKSLSVLYVSWNAPFPPLMPPKCPLVAMINHLQSPKGWQEAALRGAANRARSPHASMEINTTVYIHSYTYTWYTIF